jgi:hypothetical protein
MSEEVVAAYDAYIEFVKEANQEWSELDIMQINVFLNAETDAARLWNDPLAIQGQ